MDLCKLVKFIIIFLLVNNINFARDEAINKLKISIKLLNKYLYY